jgi:hypothetical protein
MIVLGPKDVAAGTLAVRLSDGRQFFGVTEDNFTAKIAHELSEKLTSPQWEQA